MDHFGQGKACFSIQLTKFKEQNGYRSQWMEPCAFEKSIR